MWNVGPRAGSAARGGLTVERWVYVDGRYVPAAEAGVSVFDHGFLYGDGVFEGIRAYGGRIFRLREHVDRLYDSAQAILLEIPLDRAAMAEVVLDSCRRNGISDGYVRLVVTRGRGDLGLDPRKCPRPTVVCIADTIALYPPELYENGMSIGTASVRRMGVENVNPRVKSLNYLNNILAKLEGNRAGYAEVLMLDRDGFVVECTADNIFIVRGRRLLTPPLWLGPLEGVTRGAILELARRSGLDVREDPFTRLDVWTADECFITGTGAEVVPVVECDGRTIGDGRPGPVTRDLIRAFRELVAREGVPIASVAAAAP
jgi:branched-chain amino acid aminotransferase